nr:MAG TPA: hypothetical protein [Caudoviricetes sp.]
MNKNLSLIRELRTKVKIIRFTNLQAGFSN